MTTKKLFLLPGDGIGPETMNEVRTLIDFMTKEGLAAFETDEGLVGGAAYDAHGAQHHRVGFERGFHGGLGDRLAMVVIGRAAD